METQQFFCNNLAMVKFFEELFPFFKWDSCQLCAYFTPVALHAGLNNRLWHMQINETTINDDSRRQWCLFLRWNMNMKIQSQFLTMHVLTKLKLKSEQKALINMLFRSRAPKTQQVERCQHLKKTSDFFNYYQPGRYISTCKIFAYLGSFAKVSVAEYL